MKDFCCLLLGLQEGSAVSEGRHQNTWQAPKHPQAVPAGCTRTAPALARGLAQAAGLQQASRWSTLCLEISRGKLMNHVRVHEQRDKESELDYESITLSN